MKTRFTIFLAATLLGIEAADWPQFLGPDRNGVSAEKVRTNWEAQEPTTLWKKKVGAGFAAPIVVENTVVLFHRDGNSEILAAFDLRTGKEKWQHKAPTNYRDDFGFDEGPRATPCFDNGRIYAIGAEGMVRCGDFASGEEVWTVDARKHFKMRKGFFGFAPSPLVAGENLLLNLGGENGAGIVALDKKTGKLRWKATDHEASYSSPVLARNRAVFFTREGLVILNAADGKNLVEYPCRARMHASVNAATPLVIGNTVFITASYNTGAALFRTEETRLEKIWSNDESLSAHYATPVHHAGHLYGFHGRQEHGPQFRCVDLLTGRVLWTEGAFDAGTVTLARDHLLILRESGELVLAPASPKKFQIISRVQILGSDTRAYPALSNGFLVARDKSNLVCVQVD